MRVVLNDKALLYCVLTATPIPMKKRPTSITRMLMHTRQPRRVFRAQDCGGGFGFSASASEPTLFLGSVDLESRLESIALAAGETNPVRGHEV
jgi:hypothetical protein